MTILFSLSYYSLLPTSQALPQGLQTEKRNDPIQSAEGRGVEAFGRGGS